MDGRSFNDHVDGAGGETDAEADLAEAVIERPRTFDEYRWASRLFTLCQTIAGTKVTSRSARVIDTALQLVGRFGACVAFAALQFFRGESSAADYFPEGVRATPAIVAMAVTAGFPRRRRRRGARPPAPPSLAPLSFRSIYTHVTLCQLFNGEPSPRLSPLRWRVRHPDSVRCAR